MITSNCRRRCRGCCSCARITGRGRARASGRASVHRHAFMTWLSVHLGKQQVKLQAVKAFAQQRRWGPLNGSSSVRSLGTVCESEGGRAQIESTPAWSPSSSLSRLGRTGQSKVARARAGPLLSCGTSRVAPAGLRVWLPRSCKHSLWRRCTAGRVGGAREKRRNALDREPASCSTSRRETVSTSGEASD